MNDQEVKDLARRIMANEVLTSFQVPEQHWPMVFLPITLGGEGAVPSDAALVYGEMKNTLPRSINGLPCFTSVEFVSSRDIDKLNCEMGRLQEVAKQLWSDKDE